MDDLIATIRAEIDKDERLALEADSRENNWWWAPDAESAAERHISRHDPARVLRQVAAHRRILDEILSQIQGTEDALAQMTALPGEGGIEPSDLLLLALADVYGIEPSAG